MGIFYSGFVTGLVVGFVHLHVYTVHENACCHVPLGVYVTWKQGASMYMYMQTCTPLRVLVHGSYKVLGDSNQSKAVW